MAQVKILNLTFEIIETECIEHGSNDVGRIDHVNQKIYICSSLSEERKKVVLFHEILHSIFQQLGFNEEHDNEHLIESLATSVIRVFEDNNPTFSCD